LQQQLFQSVALASHPVSLLPPPFLEVSFLHKLVTKDHTFDLLSDHDLSPSLDPLHLIQIESATHAVDSSCCDLKDSQALSAGIELNYIS
jgi:hypothetical protein